MGDNTARVKGNIAETCSFFFYETVAECEQIAWVDLEVCAPL